MLFRAEDLVPSLAQFWRGPKVDWMASVGILELAATRNLEVNRNWDKAILLCLNNLYGRYTKTNFVCWVL